MLAVKGLARTPYPLSNVVAHKLRWFGHCDGLLRSGLLVPKINLLGVRKQRCELPDGERVWCVRNRSIPWEIDFEPDGWSALTADIEFLCNFSDRCHNTRERGVRAP